MMVTAAAFAVDHLSVAAWPASTTGGSTVIEAVGLGGVGRGASCKGGGAGGATATFFLQPVVSPIKDTPRRSTVISDLTRMMISLFCEPGPLATQ